MFPSDDKLIISPAVPRLIFYLAEGSTTKSQYVVILALFIKYFFVYLQKPQYIVKMESIGERIKQRRKMLNITQEQLADIAEVGINTLTKIERDEGNPTLKVLLKVLDTLGLEIKIIIKTMNQ